MTEDVTTPARSDMAPETRAVPTEAKSAALAFLNKFNSFKDDIAMQISDLGQRLDTLSTKQAAPAFGRPALSTAAEQELPHQKAFAAYVRTGDDDHLRALDLSQKGLTTVAAEGGYLADAQTAATVANVLRGGGNLRAIANVVNVDAGVYDVLIDHAELGAVWSDQATSITAETTGPMVARISIPLYELSAMPKASQRLLDDSAFDIESWLAGRIAERFLRAESAAFVNGDGDEKPTGFLTYDKVANASWTWGNIGCVATGVDGDFHATNPADAVADVIYALGAEYRQDAHFIMNSRTAGEMRKMKDAQGRFVWVEGMGVQQPATLMGYPVTIVEDMPDIAAGKVSVAFGDFIRGYTIAERPDLRVLRDPFSAKPHVLFYATKRVGGDVTDFAAIKGLMFSATIPTV